jgi:hypothetical protein
MPVERPDVRSKFEGLGGTESRTVQQLQSGGVEEMVDQPQTGIGGPTKIGVMIVAEPGAQDQFVGDGELILPI